MPSKCDPELKAEAVRLVRDHREDYKTERDPRRQQLDRHRIRPPQAP